MAVDGLNTGSLSEQLVGAQIVATAGNGYVAAELAATESVDTFAGVGDVVVSGALSVSEIGSDTFAGTGDVVISGTLNVSEVGNDTFAGVGVAVVTGVLAVSEAGQDVFSGAGVVEVYAVFSATEGASDTAAVSGAVQVAGALATSEAIDTIYVLGDVLIHGYENASEGADTGAGQGAVLVEGDMATTDGADTLVGSGVVHITGALSTSETGLDTFAAAGVVENIGQKQERRPRRLTVRGIVDAKVFCHGGTAKTSANSPALVVINPANTIVEYDGWARVSGSKVKTTSQYIGYGCGGSSVAKRTQAVTTVHVATAVGVAVTAVLGRVSYKQALSENSTAKVYGGRSVVMLGTVDAGAQSTARPRGSFSVTDAHFCAARGERRLPPSHVVAIAAHGRLRRRVDTR
jgi:hypothetical protein